MKQLGSIRLWLILITVIVAVLYALPNLYGYKPAIQISAANERQSLPKVAQVVELLNKNKINFDSFKKTKNSILFEFANVSDQLNARTLINRTLTQTSTNIRLQPQHPNWLNSIGALPMYLGLDLRGGVYFLMEVDISRTLNDLLTRYKKDFARNLIKQGILAKPTLDKKNQEVTMEIFPNKVDSVLNWLRKTYPELRFTSNAKKSASSGSSDSKVQIKTVISKKRVAEIVNFSIQQNMTTLRNRINELGVSEPIVQRQGKNHIAVQLPGIQDTKRAKEILGATASLEFRAVNNELSVYQAVKQGRAPRGNELLYMRQTGQPILLKNEVIVSGNQVINAASSLSQQNSSPVVSITLDSAGGDKMLKFTQKNLGKRMGVVYLEFSRDETGNLVSKKTVISDAVIQGVFSNRFQISGLESAKASRNLALLLRSGALAAPMYIVEERTMGPSLGRKNIKNGFISLVVGMILILLFMPFRYKLFGVSADICLVLNVIFISAILSLFQATLTLPGIAGIVLTMGMAVDANVLIFERIREQSKLGLSSLESIKQGFDQAFQTILDSNITTLIAAVVLFVFGTGPIKGFALTLSIGILTSVFSAIYIGRFLVDLVYKKTQSTRQQKSLSI